jgi:hypothetical protein
MRPTTGLFILLAVLALAACSDVTVAPNPTNPGYIGNYGPGSSGWPTTPGTGAERRIGTGL